MFLKFTSSSGSFLITVLALGVSLLHATLCSYEVRSPHRISIIFNQAELGQLRISPGLEAVIAPAVLPRGSLNHQILLALKEVSHTEGFLPGHLAGRENVLLYYLLYSVVATQTFRSA